MAPAAPAVAAPVVPVAAAGCTTVVVNGVRVRRCGAVGYGSPIVRGRRVIVVR
jgi:hypothetical protein